ncbi:MAG: phage tail sheath family protein [Saprospiraceae bacterium]|nr:phage tail sheath family protein [Saprospiraceae bacterium]
MRTFNGVTKTPGVYIQEIRKFPPSIAQVETAIPAFIGYTEKASKRSENITLRPTRISSMLEYEEYFGKPQPEQNIVVKVEKISNREVFTAEFDWDNNLLPSAHVMYYSMQLYFANGGGPCYIISVGSYLPFGTVIADQTVFTQALAELEKEDEPTLIVFPEGQNMDPGTYFSLLTAALAQCEKLGDRFVVMDLQHNGKGLRTASDVLDQAAVFRNTLNAGDNQVKYGAVYFPNVRSTFDYEVNKNVVRVIIDGAENPLPSLSSSQKAKAELAIQQLSIYVPPSAAVVGVYARVDSTRGVWKAPANEAVFGVNDLTVKINDEMQDNLNVDVEAGRSINAIRSFVGRGIKIWGARTLAGNDNEWRYVSVRRFFNMVEESVSKGTFQFVFEPNDRNTWTRVKSMIENFLLLQWRAGALMGATPEEAFFVKVGLNETMTELDILEGRMIIEIGMAVVRPAEFIILKFSHKMLSES